MPTIAPPTLPGATTGAVRLTLRLESLAILAVLVVAYRELQASWGLFAVLFLIPDLSMLPYLKSRAVGAAAYNAAHNFGVPAAIALGAVLADSAIGLAIATIWAAHIAFDRAVGYGLKYATGFNDTHLGRVGRVARES